MSRIHDLTGQRFGRLAVLSLDPVRTNQGSARWRCICDCGTERIVSAASLKPGGTRSCGCLASEDTVARNKTHGKTNTPEYAAWGGMMRRCFNSADKSYRNYGLRGITVCERWHSFENFYADIGPRPTPKHGIDRIDNDGPYSPDNCHWATRGEQARNSRRTRHLTFKGETLCIADWAKRTGISAGRIRDRIEHNWPVEQALTVPPKQS